MAAPGGAAQRSGKLDEAQASARSCAGRPDFLPCDGLSTCTTHSHGRCFKLHWCCHLGWCHCKYVYQPMTSVCQLPSTPVPATPAGPAPPTTHLSVSLAGRFLRTAPRLRAPPCPPASPRFLPFSELFQDSYVVKRVNGKMCYVQRVPPPHTPSSPSSSSGSPPPPPPQPRLPPGKTRPPDKVDAPTGKTDACSSPSSSEDSGFNALGGNYVESCDEGSEEEEEEEEEEDDEELSSDGGSSPGRVWGQGEGQGEGQVENSVLSPSISMVEILEKIETTV